MALAILVFALTTAFESCGLFLWLRSYSAGRPVEGYAFLLTGEFLELATFVVYLHKTAGGPRDRSPAKVVGAMGLIAIFESLCWIVWIVLSERFGVIPATLALAILMHLKHDADVAAVSDTPLLRQVFTPKGILATALEVLGAFLFLSLIHDGYWGLGAGAFFLCNTAEHIVGGLIVSEALGGRGYLTSRRVGVTT